MLVLGGEEASSAKTTKLSALGKIQDCFLDENKLTSDRVGLKIFFERLRINNVHLLSASLCTMGKDPKICIFLV